MNIGLVRAWQRRIERTCERQGWAFPWWIPAYSTLALIALDVATFVQRDPLHPRATSVIAAVLVAVPALAWSLSNLVFPPWVEGVSVAVAVSLYLVQPVKLDFAPFLLLISAGEIAATSPFVIAFAVTSMHVAVVIVAAAIGDLHNAPLYVIGVVMGGDVGMAMRWQMRALTAERANSVAVGERAMLAERQRVAREVHDVVGHALSINLLHVTGARYALTQHADVADAVDSLAEAERVGRAAMADLRRTVAVLGAAAGETQALPGVEDIDALVERARTAGIDVAADYGSGVHDLGTLGDVTGLCVYRVVQESLANIAKHAPTSSARLCIERAGDSVRVTVRNSLPNGVPSGNVASGGSGLAGMAVRAEQMGASFTAGVTTGVDGEWWSVELVIPLSAGVPTGSCRARRQVDEAVS